MREPLHVGRPGWHRRALRSRYDKQGRELPCALATETSQPKSLVVEPIAEAAFVVGKQAEMKFDPGVNRAVE